MTIRLSAKQMEIFRIIRRDDGISMRSPDGWFPEYEFNGRIKRTLDALVKEGLLEKRGPWMHEEYRLTPRGKDIRLP